MLKTPLHDVHQALNAKMAEFAGYDMPINYESGVMAEHNWTRERAGLFDVSHMGQVIIEGEDAAVFLETLTPSNIKGLKDTQARYTVLMNEQGGMVDDLIITRLGEEKFFAVINAGCKDKDIRWIEDHLPDGLTMMHLKDRALIALQGPASEKIIRETLGVDLSGLDYMHFTEQAPYFFSRLGYTGEDGFEISVPEDGAKELWEKLMAHQDVKPVGLAARDSLRLDMGYPLYGHDIDDTTSPVEASLRWILRKSELERTIGADRLLKEIGNGPARKRVGFKITGKGIAREGAEILTKDGETIGEVTSGGFSPTLQGAVGQGYIQNQSLNVGDEILVRVRGRDIEAVIAKMPFVPAQTKTAKKEAA